MGLRSRKRRLAAGVDNKVPTDLEGNCALQSTLEEHLEASRSETDYFHFMWKKFLRFGWFVVLAYTFLRVGQYVHRSGPPALNVSDAAMLAFYVLNIFATFQHITNGKLGALVLLSGLCQIFLWSQNLTSALATVLPPVNTLYSLISWASMIVIGTHSVSQHAREAQLKKLEKLSS